MANTFQLDYEKTKICALRCGKSLTDVAKDAQIDCNFATRLKDGKRFRAPTVAKIANVLSIDPADLIIKECDEDAED